ncbi:MAG: hypothetical protein Q6K90_02520 [Gloeomargarita sp. HHBFW_bins_162]
MKQAGWRIDSRGRPGKRKGKRTPRKQQQAIARIHAAVQKLKDYHRPDEGFFHTDSNPF